MATLAQAIGDASMLIRASQSSQSEGSVDEFREETDRIVDLLDVTAKVMAEPDVEGARDSLRTSLGLEPLPVAAAQLSAKDAARFKRMGIDPKYVGIRDEEDLLALTAKRDESQN